MQRADPRIPSPRKDKFGSAARPDQLVVYKVRRHSDQSQVAASLPDYLVTSREGNQVRETFQRDYVAITTRMDGTLERIGDALVFRTDVTRAIAP